MVVSDVLSLETFGPLGGRNTYSRPASLPILPARISLVNLVPPLGRQASPLVDRKQSYVKWALVDACCNFALPTRITTGFANKETHRRPVARQTLFEILSKEEGKTFLPIISSRETVSVIAQVGLGGNHCQLCECPAILSTADNHSVCGQDNTKAPIAISRLRRLNLGASTSRTAPEITERGELPPTVNSKMQHLASRLTVLTPTVSIIKPLVKSPVRSAARRVAIAVILFIIIIKAE